MKKLIRNPEAQLEMNKGVQAVADIVRCTLGPLGRNVAIMNTKDGGSQPLLTDDGVRVVEFSLNTLNDLELLGAKLVYSSSKKTEEEVGDGTTSTYLLAAKAIDTYVKDMNSDESPQFKELNPVLIRKGLNKAKDAVLDYLVTLKQPITSRETLINIATNSSGSKEIGEIVGDLRYKLGLDGLVNIRMSRNNRDVIRYSNGYEFSSGFVHQDDFTGRPIDCYDPVVLVIDKMIMSATDAIAIVNSYKHIVIDKLKLNYDTPMVVMANKIDGEALQIIYQQWFLRTDKIQVPIIPVEIPFTSDHNGTLVDLCTISGAKLISSQDNGALTVQSLVESYGRVANINTSKKMTYIVAYDDDKTKNAINELVSDLKTKRDALTTVDTSAEDADLAVRISKLNGVAVTIEVGAQNDIERQERKLKYDDAVLATHAARKDGVVIGGGYTLLKCFAHLAANDTKYLPDNKSEKYGFMLLVSMLTQPFSLIAENSGIADPNTLLRDLYMKPDDDQMDYYKIMYKFLKRNIVYIDFDNLSIGRLPVNTTKELTYDPYLVTKSVIENATAAIALFISTENSVLCSF